VSEDSLLSLSVEELLAAFATRRAAPGGGAAAGLTVALAAGLAAMAARYGDPSPPATAGVHSLVERAEGLRRRAALLADADAAAYGRYLDATRLPRGPDADGRRRAVRAALTEATDVPLEIAGVAAEVADLAAALARSSKADLRGDAAAAVLLASAAATTAAILVGENLGRDVDDPRRDRAAMLAGSAQAAAAAVVELFGPQ